MSFIKKELKFRKKTQITTTANATSTNSNVINTTNKLINELINKDDINARITNLSNELINVRITNLSNELLETLKLLENCTSCKKYNIREKDFDKLHKLLNEIELEQERMI